MLIEEIKNIKSEKNDLRKFGLTVGLVTGLLGGLFYWRGKDFYTIFLVISFALLFLGIVIPSVLKPLHKAWMTFAVILGWFMTRVILTILFYLIVTPLGLIAKIFGNDFLNMKFDKNANSYWIPQKKSKVDKKAYEKQF